MQEARRGPINAPVADVNVFNEVVQAFNEHEGVIPADGETPIAAASQQVQQDAASFLGHIVDALHDETCALRARVEPPAQAEGDDDEDGWLQVHSCSCRNCLLQSPRLIFAVASRCVALSAHLMTCAHAAKCRL